MKKIFDTDRRIKLGIWGLGRGGNFIKSAAALNIDVVAGCDVHPQMRENFQKIVPDALCTADAEEFLSSDIDAVLIATFLPDHAKHTIQALRAGKHVMCEVIPFMTPADAVAVIEAVEASGKVYNLLENYPFSKEKMYLRKLWDEGFFGEFMYSEFEYVHELRVLAYAYNTTPVLPVTPGYCVHNWRSRINMHYYCTHSLGPAMLIPGLRPVRVTALPEQVALPGFLECEGKGNLCPSLIQMNNGGVVRNLMGSSTSDSRRFRIWGTKAAAEFNRDELLIRTGACGLGSQLKIKAEFPELAEYAAGTGHGGGDFWELYYFARQIFTGEAAPWDVYKAADVTLAGIMAIRSEKRNGEPQDIPDLRDPAMREKYRYDQGEIDGFYKFDPQNVFPAGHDPEKSGRFTRLMADLYPADMRNGLPLCANAFDGMRLFDHLAGREDKLLVRESVSKLIRELPEIARNLRELDELGKLYSDSMPGRIIKRIIDSSETSRILAVESTCKGLQDFLDAPENRY